MNNPCDGASQHQKGSVVFCPYVGVAYDTRPPTVEYGKAYFDHYVALAGTDMSVKLCDFRTKLTEQYCTCLLDFGCGSGEFIACSRLPVFGYDINPHAVARLWDRGKYYVNPLINDVPKMVDGWTFWDSLEHLSAPHIALDRVRKGNHVFVSMPVYNDIGQLEQSKHHKRGEHLWWFTVKGFLWYVDQLGFDTVLVSDEESRLGRESIMTFVLRKI